MNLSGILPLIAEHPIYSSFLTDVRAGQSDRAPLSIYGPARTVLAASLARELGGTVIYLVARSEHARQAYEELQVWLPPANGLATVSLLSDPNSLPYERIPWSRGDFARRGSAR